MKNKGLFQKYYIEKISNPEKQIDAIVLEFDDPIAREGIWSWAIEMRNNGYYKCYSDTIDKLNSYQQEYVKHENHTERLLEVHKKSKEELIAVIHECRTFLIDQRLTTKIKISKLESKLDELCPNILPRERA